MFRSPGTAAACPERPGASGSPESVWLFFFFSACALKVSVWLVQQAAPVSSLPQSYAMDAFNASTQQQHCYTQQAHGHPSGIIFAGSCFSNAASPRRKNSPVSLSRQRTSATQKRGVRPRLPKDRSSSALFYLERPPPCVTLAGTFRAPPLCRERECVASTATATTRETAAKAVFSDCFFRPAAARCTTTHQRENPLFGARDACEQ